MKVFDGVCTQEEVLKMECDVLSVLQFDVTFPSANRFIERFSRLAQLSERQQLMATYFADTALLDAGLVVEPPSRIAAACIYAVHMLFKEKRTALWNSTLSKHTTYRESDIG